jgi:hypothetical protein
MAASNDQLTRDRNTCSKPFPFVPYSLWEWWWWPVHAVYLVINVNHGTVKKEKKHTTARDASRLLSSLGPTGVVVVVVARTHSLFASK